MAEARSETLTVSRDGSGNVNRLIRAAQSAEVEVVGSIDGEFLARTKENLVSGVAYSLQRALNARPPQEVVEAVLGRIRLLKYAPRVDEMACAELATTIRDAATGFAAQGAESAAKVTAVAELVVHLAVGHARHDNELQ